MGNICRMKHACFLIPSGGDAVFAFHIKHPYFPSDSAITPPPSSVLRRKTCFLPVQINTKYSVDKSIHKPRKVGIF